MALDFPNRLVGQRRTMRFGTRTLTDAALGVGREAWAVGGAIATYRNGFATPVRPTTAEPVDQRTGGARSRVRAQRRGVVDSSAPDSGRRVLRVPPVTYGVDDEVPRIAARIAEQVDAIVASRSVERVHLVGHSLGGVAIRYWHDLLGGDAPRRRSGDVGRSAPRHDVDPVAVPERSRP